MNMSDRSSRDMQGGSGEQNTPSGLLIGNSAIDEFYSDGNMQYEVRGGNAYNAARWVDHHGIETSLATILGSDFPETGQIDVSESLESEAESPRCRVHLNENSEPEYREWMPADFEETIDIPEEDYDMVHLTAGVDTYGHAFNNVDAEVKALSPGGRIGDYDFSTLRRALNEADVVFANDEEAEVYESRFETPLEQAVRDHDIDQFFVTEASEITLYTPEEITRFDVDKIENPPDTTGAGDAFANTYLSKMMLGGSTETAVEAGISNARETVLRLGSLPEFMYDYDRRDSSRNIERQKV